MVSFLFNVQITLQGKFKGDTEEHTLDGSVDWHGRPAIRAKSGRWVAGTIVLCKIPNISIAGPIFIYFSLCFNI